MINILKGAQHELDDAFEYYHQIPADVNSTDSHTEYFTMLKRPI